MRGIGSVVTQGLLLAFRRRILSSKALGLDTSYAVDTKSPSTALHSFSPSFTLKSISLVMPKILNPKPKTLNT